VICWDCEQIADDFVMETRQVSGGDGGTFANDFKKVPVHNSRRVCAAARAESQKCVKCHIADKGSMLVLRDSRGQRYLQHWKACPPEAFTGFNDIQAQQQPDQSNA